MAIHSRANLKKLGYGLLAVATTLIVFACSENTLPITERAIAERAIAERATVEGATVEASLSDQDPASRSNPDTLVILWDKGYVTEEDEAIQKVVADWEMQGGLPVDLSFYNSGEIAPKTLRASHAGIRPDILFAAKSVYPVPDWEGKLADVTEVVTPLAQSYTDTALKAAKVYGSKKANNRYYAVPLNQSTTHIYYWKDFLQEAGYTPADIPTDWDDFWTFWKTVQDNLSDTYPDLRSIGLPYAKGATDIYHIFEHVLSAYDVTLLDDDGNLLLDDPQLKAGLKADIAQCLNWYFQFYKEGYVPANAVNWLDPENNRNLLDRNVVMTPNPTLSIPAAVRNDEVIYREKLGTVEFPNKPNGEPLLHFVSIRQAVVFEDAPHLQVAKDFLTYLIQPTVLSDFLEASYGRYIPPAMSQIEADTFWQDSSDPHLSTVVKTLTDGQTQPFPNVLSPAYGTVMEQNVWGQVIHQMVVENLSAEVAADRAIAKIQAIFREQS